MAEDFPPKNKMMKAPPAKKGFHFASDGVHEAAYIEADTIEEAENLYHKSKKLLFPGAGGTVSTAAQTEPEQEAV